MDSDQSKVIRVIVDGTKMYEFHQGNDGLYSYDMRNEPITINNDNKKQVTFYPINSINFLNTVENNKLRYTKDEIRRATLEKELQKNMGYISNSTLKKYINKGLIKNCDLKEKILIGASRFLVHKYQF